jgi:hypothetical protein
MNNNSWERMRKKNDRREYAKDIHMNARDNVSSPLLDFRWAPHQWEDPLTGTQVVKLSPDQPLHFRNVYFRTPLFTPDGRTMLMGAVSPDWDFCRFDDPTRADCRVVESQLIALDLLNGEMTNLGSFKAGVNGLWFAAAPRGRIVHVIVNCVDHEEIEQIEIDSGRRRRIVPSMPFRFIWEAECSADLRYIYTPSVPFPNPAGMSNTEAYHRGATLIQRSTMYRIDLETGETTTAFDVNWSLAHPNPNPVRPELFMCCQDGDMSQPGYQRVRVMDFVSDRWLDMPWWLGEASCGHEMWSANGRAVYCHGGFHGWQIINRFRFDHGAWELFVVPIGAGDSAHLHVAPDETFLIGEGKNWGWNTEHEAAGKAGDGDNPWAFDGVGCHSLGEVIWKFELPQESLLMPGHGFRRRDDLLAPVYRNPDKVVRTTPLCRFRSLARLLNKPMRLENNTVVTPDSRWAVIQSCSEKGLFELWAARVT